MRDPKLLPLLMLYSCDEESVEGITRFQKLVFLTQKENDYIDEYYFRPDSYGPFSVELYNDIDELVRNGYVVCRTEETSSGNEKHSYQLTEKGREFVDRIMNINRDQYSRISGDLCRTKEKYNAMPLLKLLKRIYHTYPEMAKNSKLDLV